MPGHAKYPFSVWLQHGYETTEELEPQYSKDGRTVTCWVSDELIQNADTVRWESDGMGHPSKIRILTERSHDTSRRSRSGSDLRSAGLRPVASELIKLRTSSERSSLRRSYSDHERLQRTSNERILTIKIEVFVSAQRTSTGYASGVLPLSKSKTQARSERRPSNARSYPYRSSRRLITSVEPKSVMTTDQSDSPPLSLVFCFRARPNILRSTYQSPPYVAPVLAALKEQESEGTEEEEVKAEVSSYSETSTYGSETSTIIDGSPTTVPKLASPINLVPRAAKDENASPKQTDHGPCSLSNEHTNNIGHKTAYEIERHLTRVEESLKETQATLLRLRKFLSESTCDRDRYPLRIL